VTVIKENGKRKAFCVMVPEVRNASGTGEGENGGDWEVGG